MGLINAGFQKVCSLNSILGLAYVNDNLHFTVNKSVQLLAAARATAAFYFAIKVRCYSPFSLHGKTVYLEVRPFCHVNRRRFKIDRFNV